MDEGSAQPEEKGQTENNDQLYIFPKKPQIGPPPEIFFPFYLILQPLLMFFTVSSGSIYICLFDIRMLLNNTWKNQTKIPSKILSLCH